MIVTSAALDFDAFYQAHFRQTVAMTYGLTADRADAQDIAQEAFCRAWQRWPAVSAYDNPIGWVRHVATNLALSRWRRLKVATAHLMDHRPADERELSPDRVDLVAALRELPVAQRKAVVLHYLVDLPVEDVAQELNVPVGTVKSWLHRGRAALWASLADDTRAIAAPGAPDEVRARGDRRRRNRRALLTTAVFILVAALAVGAFVLGGQSRSHLPPVAPTPTSASSVPVAWHIGELDRSETRLTVFVDPIDCQEISLPQAEVRYTDTTAEVLISAQLRVGGNCTSPVGLPVTVTLPAALGTRLVFDGLADRLPRQIARRASLPIPPAAWAEGPAPATWQRDQGWSVWYQKDGQEVQFTDFDLSAPPVGEAVTIGGQAGTLEALSSSYKFVWHPANDARAYQLTVLTNEGSSISKPDFIALLNTFSWPAVSASGDKTPR